VEHINQSRATRYLCDQHTFPKKRVRRKHELDPGWECSGGWLLHRVVSQALVAGSSVCRRIFLVSCLDAARKPWHKNPTSGLPGTVGQCTRQPARTGWTASQGGGWRVHRTRAQGSATRTRERERAAESRDGPNSTMAQGSHVQCLELLALTNCPRFVCDCVLF
jgi:hypothetical protein